jgi:hypothetical protein
VHLSCGTQGTLANQEWAAVQAAFCELLLSKILHLFALIWAVLRKQKPNSLCTVTHGSVPLPAAPTAAQATGISLTVADTSSRWKATIRALEKAVEPQSS